MKPLFKTLTCMMALMCSARAGAADLTVVIDDVKSAEGQLMIAVFDSAATFLQQPTKAVQAPAVAGSATVVLKNMPAGGYAISLYHDANGNGKMDRNAVGMPVEDYGFSNNAMGRRGAPSFEQARVVLPAAGAVIHISLN